MVAGELPARPGLLSAGSGPVDIYNNVDPGATWPTTTAAACAS